MPKMGLELTAFAFAPADHAHRVATDEAAVQAQRMTNCTATVA